MLIGSCLPLIAGDLTLAVAANARYAVNNIVEKFEKETSIKCRLVVASSGKLSAQIRNGAPFHLFLSADTSYPAALIKDNFAASPLLIYAYGTLVIWSETAADSSSLDSILQAPKSRIAIANPGTAPYGAAALETWKHLYPEKTDHHFIYGSSISQVNQYIQLKAVDIGFTSRSTLFHLGEAVQGFWKEVSDKLHFPLAQGAIILNAASEVERRKAERFLQFLTEPSATQILHNYGYRIE
ncbi:MAG: molybdate ABC transporter substrate-binding protein [Calditrichota bacterium]